ncbi:MAG: phosphotransacetylase family protein [Nitrospinae bacterium]|nr:phosphotransacetylase family protein [Nitrospinota bacterium]
MKSIFINSVGVKSGKSLLAWALGLIFEKDGLKVGYFKPLGVQPEVVDGVLTDHDAHLMKNVLKLKDPYHLICPVVLNHDTIFAVFRRKVGGILKEIEDSYRKLSMDKDIVIIKGGNSFFDGSIVGANGVTLTKALNMKVLLVDRFISDVTFVDNVRFIKELLGDRLQGVIITQVMPEKIDYVNNVVIPFIEGDGIPVYGSIPEDKFLGAISIRKASEVVAGEVICCKDRLEELATNYVIGAMDLELAINYFRRINNKIVITGADRSDLQIAAMETSTKGIILTGGRYPNSVVIGKAEEKGVPIIVVNLDTYSTIERLDKAVITLDFEDEKKIGRYMELFRKNVDINRLKEGFGMG